MGKVFVKSVTLNGKPIDFTHRIKVTLKKISPKKNIQIRLKRLSKNDIDEALNVKETKKVATIPDNRTRKNLWKTNETMDPKRSAKDVNAKKTNGKLVDSPNEIKAMANKIKHCQVNLIRMSKQEYENALIHSMPLNGNIAKGNLSNMHN